MNLLEHCIIPDWPAPSGVRALQTTRQGGVSLAPYDNFNLGGHVGDNPFSVEHNRNLLNQLSHSRPLWLEQVHGKLVIDTDLSDNQSGYDHIPTADASIARQRSTACAVMTADCLPVLLCDKQGLVVGAVHAGWKGLAAGVIEAAVKAMDVLPQNLMAWLGPAISQEYFEVGDEVRAMFIANNLDATWAFLPGQSGKWHADIYALARLRLSALGITRFYGGEYCTYREPEKFFSYRRDGVTGRMATLIWLE